MKTDEKFDINEWQRMVTGKLYNPDNDLIKKRHNRGLTNCDKFNRVPLYRKKTKAKALERLIPSSKGNNLTIFSPFYCEYGININIGKDCFINYNCTFLDVAPITIGNGVFIGASATLATPNHPFLKNERLYNSYPDGFYNLEYAKPIIIKDGCWICSSVTICGGVTIGENSIIASGAVVTKDIPANCIASGVPAKIVRMIDEDDKINVWETYIRNETPTSIRKLKN